MENNNNDLMNEMLSVINKLYKDIGVDVDNSYDEKCK